MKKRTAVKKAKSAYKLAQILGITRQAVSKWPSDAEIPVAQEAKLRELYPQWFAVRVEKVRADNGRAVA
jgi:predicted transcriptional regulator